MSSPPERDTTKRMLDCPNCQRRFEPGQGRRRDPRCPDCGSRLVGAAGPEESKVLRHLYGRRVAPVQVLRPGRSVPAMTVRLR